MATKKEKAEIIEKAAGEVKKGFSLSKFKEKKGLGAENAKYKPQTWIPLSKAWQEVTTLPGIPQGHITVLRGWSDTGKTTTLVEAAVSCQRKGILPVLIITEMKWDFSYCKKMGFQVEEIVDQETGEITGYDGFFIYADRSQLNTIEDVATFMADLLDEQAKGNLPYDLCFLWDSVGSIPCRMSVESKSNSNMWNAGALQTQFGGFINQKIVLSRKQTSPFLNTFVVITKVWVSPPETIMSSPRMQSKGGNCFIYDSSLIVDYGNIANSGTVKLKATCKGREFEWGKRVNVSVFKCHLSNITSKGKLIMTPTGFISLNDVEKYKEANKASWAAQIGANAEELSFEEEESSDETGGSSLMYDVDSRG